MEPATDRIQQIREEMESLQKQRDHLSGCRRELGIRRMILNCELQQLLADSQRGVTQVSREDWERYYLAGLAAVKPATG